MDRRKVIQIGAGPLLFVFCAFFLTPLFTFPQACAVGTTLWMGLWWIFRPVSITVTAFLPIVINSLFDLVPMNDIISRYFAEIVVLLLGSDLICMTWTATGLDKRLSLKALCAIGPSVKQQIAVWFTAATVLSIFLPNVVVCTLFVPIAIRMLSFLGVKDIGASRLAVPILLAIVWGAGVGGFGSPLGGAANLVAIAYLEDITGHEFMYWDWIERFTLPLIAVMALNIVFLWRIRLRTKKLPGSSEYFRQAYDALGGMTRDEWVAAVLFLAATVLAFVRPLYADLLPALKPAYVFMLGGMLTFVIPRTNGEVFCTWKRAEKDIMWGMLFLFAGGLALGTLVTETGAATRIAELITKLPLAGGIETIFVLNVFSTVLTEISSNTAAAAIAIPVIRSITETLGLNPIGYIYIAIIAVNCAYVLPVSIRAIAVSFGLDPKQMFTHGLRLSAATVVLITILGWLMMVLWPGFSAG